MEDMMFDTLSYEEITDSIDQLSMRERKFVIWYILKEYYLPALEKEKLKPIEECRTESQYAVQKMFREHIRVGKEVVDVLTFDLF